ncbi:MAG: Ig-like domain repeat protein [Labilithrix sp.]|nr:Ig-like domain repeat protein [Labilithrix sp.]
MNTAQGQGGAPTGTIELLDGATSLGTQPLVAGVASISTAGLAAGTHALREVQRRPDVRRGDRHRLADHRQGRDDDDPRLLRQPLERRRRRHVQRHRRVGGHRLHRRRRDLRWNDVARQGDAHERQSELLDQDARARHQRDLHRQRELREQQLAEREAVCPCRDHVTLARRRIAGPGRRCVSRSAPRRLGLQREPVGVDEHAPRSRDVRARGHRYDADASPPCAGDVRFEPSIGTMRSSTSTTRTNHGDRASGRRTP